MVFFSRILERRRSEKALRVFAVVVLSLATASCGDGEKIAALQSQIAAKDVEIKDLKAQITLKDNDISSLKTVLITSKEQEGYYKGVVEANKDTLAANLKAIEACRTPQNVEVISAALEEVKKSCATTSSALNKLAQPKPDDSQETITEPATPTDPCAQSNSPGCLPNPVTVNEPPASSQGKDAKDKKSMEKTVLLAAAYVACEFYSAGTCTFVLAAVGMQLGLEPSEVRAESMQAYQQLKDEIDKRGVAIPNPLGGEPIVLTPKTAGDVLSANEAYRKLSDKDKQNPCKIIQIYQKVDVIDQFIGSLASPLKFRNKEQKEKAKLAASKIDANLAVWLSRIPYEGDGNEGYSCD